MKSIARLGGLALVEKPAPPTTCPRGCGKTWAFGDSWHKYLGHLGLHGLADKYFNGDIQAAQRRLRENGIAKTDPAPWNRAFKPYRKIGEK